MVGGNANSELLYLLPTQSVVANEIHSKPRLLLKNDTIGASCLWLLSGQVSQVKA